MPEPQTETDGLHPPGGKPPTAIGNSGGGWIPYDDDFSGFQPPEGHHRLVVEDDRGRRQFFLDAPSYTIGRAAQCDICLTSQFASRCHATLVQFPQADGSYRYRILDGDGNSKPSANGIVVNGHKLKAKDLQHEDEIVFGPQVRAIYYYLMRDRPPDTA